MSEKCSLQFSFESYERLARDEFDVLVAVWEEGGHLDVLELEALEVVDLARGDLQAGDDLRVRHDDLEVAVMDVKVLCQPDLHGEGHRGRVWNGLVQ